jgi:hypothetical protein
MMHDVPEPIGKWCPFCLFDMRQSEVDSHVREKHPDRVVEWDSIRPEKKAPRGSIPRRGSVGVWVGLIVGVAYVVGRIISVW